MKPLSIRWRMMLWNTVAFAFLLVGFGVLVYALLRQAHYDQVDRKLASRLEQLRQEVQGEPDPRRHLTRWVHKARRPSAVTAVFDSQGDLVAQDERLDSIDRTHWPAQPNRLSGPQFWSEHLPRLGHQRIAWARVPAGGETYTVLLTASLAHVDEEMALVVASLAVTIPLTLAVAAGLAYGLARRALRPVERLRQQADEITAERLDRRLPVTNPRDELGLLAGTVNEMIGRLERSFAEVRRFTADASHELRTPIAVIRAETEEALDRTPEKAEHRALLLSVLEECHRLTRMTDQLLTLSREDAGVAGAVMEPVDLGELVEDVAEAMRPLAVGRGHRLAVESGDEIHVIGDPSRLEQVVRNLLDNAIKYTPPGGMIRAAVGRESAEAVVTVEDTGVGIPEEHLPRVFDRFYRVESSRSRAAGGAGLGLSIVRSIVTAHGGSIHVESAPGQGSVFRVRLPAAPEPPHEKARQLSAISCWATLMAYF